MRDSTHTPIDKWDPTSVGAALGTDEPPVLKGVARSAYGALGDLDPVMLARLQARVLECHRSLENA